MNPDFGVIHGPTLEVYQLIFQRQLELSGKNAAHGDEDVDEEVKGEASNERLWGSDLGLFSSGLFGFYQFAAFEVKEIFLDLIENHYLCLKQELHVSFSGFMACMLPALDDQSEKI